MTNDINQPILSYDQLSKLEKRMVDKVRETPRTIQELADNLGVTYHTARRYAIILERNRFIEESGTLRNKAKVYVLRDTDPDKLDSIPYLKDYVSNRNIKAHVLLQAIGNEDELAAVRAAKAIPSYVAQLLYIAMLINKGLIQHEELTELRNTMQRDYIALNNAMQFIRQILEQPQWWDPKRLRVMPLDEHYNYEQVREAYRESTDKEATL